MASHTSHVDGCNWYVDSACTRHMAIDENLFVTLDRSDRTKVKLGNGALVQAQGRGSVKFPCDEGMKLIHDVLYVPNLTQNLLSVAQLLHKNYSLNFKDKKCVIYDPKGCEVAKISMIDNSFRISMIPSFGTKGLVITTLVHWCICNQRLWCLMYPKLICPEMLVTHVNLVKCIDDPFLKEVFGGLRKS